MLEGVMTAIAVFCVAGAVVSLCRRRREYRHLERMLENFRSDRGIKENENDETCLLYTSSAGMYVKFDCQ